MHYFVAVAEALSFTKAAVMLHLAQPSLTRQIERAGRGTRCPASQSDKNKR